MGQMQRISVRLTSVQLSYLRSLASTLQIEQADVIRLAITRLAQWEGIAPAPPIMEFLKDITREEEEPGS